MWSDIQERSIRMNLKHITKERKKKIKITIPVMRRLERPVLRSSLRIIFTETVEARLWLSTTLERSSTRPRQSNREQEIISHYRLTANYRNMYIICSRRRSRELFCLSLQVLTVQEMTVRILWSRSRKYIIHLLAIVWSTLRISMEIRRHPMRRRCIERFRL